MFKMGIFFCGHISSRSSERVHMKNNVYNYTNEELIQASFKQYLLNEYMFYVLICP